ncbi:DUF3159 domain-containing protein [Micromonospora sp. D93]|uniref:DUF3159 domain-containing protein n=1 Tax=Micromonospora sp. D93 TaxID=2824886 RepID=UPI001B358CEC|nr:DUF3159 domain-containing protein [Micromonospora sp. D93]MBQ1020188.1 DUF3159 domain-containing protein [Micromonospora sp. D93]
MSDQRATLTIGDRMPEHDVSRHPEPPPRSGPPQGRRQGPESGWSAIRQIWSDPDRWVEIAVAAAPGLVFVAVNVVATLYPAIIAAAAAAVAGLGFRLARRQSPRSALIGILVVTVCAVVAAVTGDARGFFLVPTLIPFAVIMACLATIIARRPLTGLLLNRVTGGPRDWYRNTALRRVHLAATSAAIGINVINAAVQVIFYERGDTVVLAVAHAATGPVFATLVAVTIVAVRKTLAAQR